MMTKQEKMELAAIVAQAVVEAMKATTATPTSANKGRKSAIPNEAPKTSKQKSTKALEEMISNERREVAEMMKKGRGSATSKKTKTAKYSTDLKDYEPKKKGGFYDWTSYKSNRTKFCYAYATSGRAISCFENGERYCTFEQIEGEYAEAKKMFEKKYIYTKKADR